MRILEVSFSSNMNNYSMMIHWEKSRWHFESRKLNLALLTVLYLKIQIEQAEFFKEDLGFYASIQYCVINKNPHFACARFNDHLTMTLFEVVKTVNEKN
jgi:hypothetical protein